MFFENPAWLWAAGSAVIPLILHLFELRRYKKVLFSDIRFLKQIEEKNKSQKRLKDLLILICRMLLLIGVAIAFAKPVWQPNQNPEHNTTTVSVFVDNSYSMNAISGAGPLVEVAKNKARSIINAYANEVKFQLLTNALSGAEQRWLTKNDALTAVSEIKPVGFSASAQQIVARHKSLTNTTNFTTLYLISDFQQKQFAELLNLHDTLVNLICLPTIAKQNNNVGIDTVYESYSSSLHFSEKLILVKVTNYGTETVSGVSLNLHVNGTQKGLTNLTLAPAETQTKSFRVNFTDTVWSKAELSLTDYPIVYDDKLYFTVPPTAKKRVLEITNIESPFVKKLFEDDAQFEYTQLPYNLIPYQQLDKYSFIIFNQPTELSSGLIEQLKIYTEQGGQVLVIPAQKISNNYLAPFSDAFNLPYFGQFNAAPVKVSKIAVNHPVYKNVFNQLKNNTLLPSAWQHYSLTIKSNTLGTPLLTLANNETFLWFNNIKKGGISILASPLDSKFTDFAFNGIFVPTLINLALNKQHKSALYFLCQSNQQIPVNSTNKQTINAINIKGNGFEFLLDVSSRNHQPYFFANQIPYSGFAQINQAKTNTNLMWCAFNVSRNESDLNNLSNQLANLKNHWRSLIINTNQPEVLESGLKQSLNGLPLWRWFVAVALLMALTEMALIRWLK